MSDFLFKKQMVETNSSNGKCYMRLLPLCGGFYSCSTTVLEDVIVKLSMALGSNPRGMKVITELWFANREMLGLTEPIDESDIFKTDFSDEIMASKCRFSLEDIGGIYHIGSYTTECNCEDSIFCDHGYSAKLVVCTLACENVYVGASKINFAELCRKSPEYYEDDSDDEDEDNTDIQPNVEDVRFSKSKVEEYKKEDADGDVAKLFSIVEKLKNENKKLKQETSDLNSFNRFGNPAPNWKAKQEVIGEEIKGLLMKDKRGNGSLLTVEPSDSSSQIQRYKKKFLNSGTVYTVNGSKLTKVDEEAESFGQSNDREVICGYLKTKSIVKKQKDSLDKIAPINGLCMPYRNGRLNELCHFHTAIDSLMRLKRINSHYDAIRFIATYNAQTPSEEYAYQMIIRTFDLKTNVVLANPFNIPFLELGMLISDDSLVKSMDLLRLEYKSLWFEEMKSLHVPDFHNEYRGYQESKITTSSESVLKHFKNATKFKESDSSRARIKSSSILSIVKG